MSLPAPEDRLTRKEAAVVLGVCPHVVSRYSRGSYLGVPLQRIEVGGKCWYTRELIEDWLERVKAKKDSLSQRETETLREYNARQRATWARLKAKGMKVGNKA